MCVKVGENNIIAINSESTYGRQRYTLAHELCHLYFHKNLNNSICPKDSDRTKDEKEVEADIFASYFLAPYESLKSYITNTLGKDKGELNVEDVVNIEQYYGLSRQATLNRLVSEGYITRIKADTMRSGIIRSALKQGYDEKLYLPSEESKKYYTIGKYIKIAEELNNKEKVSSGKYEELLLDAYRSDIVYGLDDEVEIYD
nr:ImmA/IrrE family metallo-endopeptidase [Clostridium tertium]